MNQTRFYTTRQSCQHNTPPNLLKISHIHCRSIAFIPTNYKGFGCRGEVENERKNSNVTMPTPDHGTTSKKNNLRPFHETLQRRERRSSKVATLNVALWPKFFMRFCTFTKQFIASTHIYRNIAAPTAIPTPVSTDVTIMVKLNSRNCSRPHIKHIKQIGLNCLSKCKTNS